MNDKIPVQFQFQGRQTTGYLHQALGNGTNVWFLIVNRYHWGQLVKYKNDEWRMTNTKGDLLHLSDYFRDVVIAWYQ